MNLEIGMDIYTILILWITFITNENLLCGTQETRFNALCRKSPNGDICMLVADSLCHRAETLL